MNRTDPRPQERGSSPRERGSSIVEIAIGGALLAVLGVAALSLTAASRDGAAAARVATMQTTALRNASEVLREELMQTSAARLVVTEVAGQNDIVTMQRPLPAAGATPVWGAFDNQAAPALRMRADHFTRFVVVNGAGGRELRRQILSPDLTLVGEVVIARGLASGSDNPPGFAADPVGDMWRITLGLARIPNRPPVSIQFDVALKN